MNSKPRFRSAFWRALTKIETGKVNGRWMALRNSLAVALPLGIGIAIGKPLGAVAVASGALNVSYSDGIDPYAHRARRMLAWSLLGALAVFTGSVTGNYHWAAVLVAAAWAFVAGMCVSTGTRAGDLGLNTLVALIVYSARGALSPKGALITAGLVLGGGLFQTILALLFWPIHRYDPERRAVGKAYLDLAKELGPHADPLLSGPMSAPTMQVQETLMALGRDHTIEGERFRLMLDQADRIRLSAFMMDRLRSEAKHRTHRSGEEEAAVYAHYIDRLIDRSSKFLATVGECLLAGKCGEEHARLAGELRALAQEAQDRKIRSADPLAGEIASATDTLAGQLRAAAELANHSIPEGLEAFAKREAGQPWRLQVTGWLGTLRANLDPRSAFFRHAVRLTVCVTLGDALGRAVNGQRSYWIPMTIAVVLKPDFTTTLSRGVLRLAGTFAGLILATMLYHLLPESAPTQILLVGAFTFVMRYIGPANYGVFSVAISGLIVFLIAETGVPPGEVVLQRAINTAVGGVFALLAYAVWPTWERSQVGEMVAEMIDGCREYFRKVIERFGRDDETLEGEIDRARRAWRRTRSNAEASVDRVSSEPRITSEKLDCLTSMLASSHALVHAMMGIEAGVSQRPVSTEPEAFRTFAKDVEFTLYFLGQALRGSTGATQTLPKLRDDHRRLVEARDSFSPTDEFIVLETDRITTSLNTLREQVMRFVA